MEKEKLFQSTEVSSYTKSVKIYGLFQSIGSNISKNIVEKVTEIAFMKLSVFQESETKI